MSSWRCALVGRGTVRLARPVALSLVGLAWAAVALGQQNAGRQVDASPATASAAQATDVTALGLIAGRPTVRPRRAETPPDIDGRLDDAAWLTAAKLSGFSQQAPLEGAPPTEATEATDAWVAYDSDNIYFGFHLHYSDPSIMRANRVDRDTAWQDDLITIYIDTFLDQQRAFDFDLNAFNVQGDGIVNAGSGFGGPIPVADRSWDALFYSATQIVDDGYTAEMAIPFKSLRYPQRERGAPHQWGFQVVREIKGKNQENVVWAPMSRDVAGSTRRGCSRCGRTTAVATRSSSTSRTPFSAGAAAPGSARRCVRTPGSARTSASTPAG